MTRLSYSTFFTVFVLSGAILLCSTTAYPQSDLRLVLSDAPPSVPPSPDDEPARSVDRTSGLTLTELQEMASENNPTIQQASELIERARGKWDQAGRYPNPVVGYISSEVGNNGKAGQQGAFISQEIVTGGKIRLDLAVASQEINRAGSQLEVQRLRVLNDVEIRFYEVLGAQQAILVAMQLEDVAKEGVNIADRLLKAQQGTRADLLQAKIAMNEVRIILRNAKNRHSIAWKKLVNVIGSPHMERNVLAGKLDDGSPQLDWETTWQEILASSPELQAAQARINREQSRVSRERATPTPNINLQLAPQYDFSTNTTVANIQIGIALPIRNRNRGNIYAASADLRRAQQEMSRLELSLRDRLATAFGKYVNARNEVELYRDKILPSAKENLKLTTTGYEQGEFSFLRVLTARSTYFKTNVAYVNSLTEQRKAAVAITGMVLTGGLDSVPVE